MIMYLVIPLVSAAVFYAARQRQQPPHSWNVLVDPTSVADTVRLIRSISRDGNEDSDTLATRLERIFHTFRPTERTLRQLSIMQQTVVGQGNVDEFCVVLVFSIAMMCVCVDSDRNIRRTMSLPNMHRT